MHRSAETGRHRRGLSAKEHEHRRPDSRGGQHGANTRASSLGTEPVRRTTPALTSDDATRGAYRRFLQRTQDVFVVSVDYPGGMSALIRDRERVTIDFVRLLRTI